MEPPRRVPPRQRRRRRPPPGSAPGTLVAAPHAVTTQLRAVGYGPEGAEERQGITLAELPALRARFPLVWIDVAGLSDLDTVRQVGEQFGLHRLAIEDAVHVHQRAKVEDYPTHDFLVLRTVNPGEHLDSEQLAICVGADFVVTFQERPGDCFDAIRARLRDPSGRIAAAGADTLAYALLDAAVDVYFPVMEQCGDRLEAIEQRILDHAEARAIAADLHCLRRELLELRRSLWPLREATGALLRNECPRFSAAVLPYLRDVHDHVIQLLDLLENYREMAGSLLELQLSTASMRLNEVMKVLTVIATIFIPLTFVVGVYGMNFDVMPELRWRYGYLLCWALMAAIAVGMLWWFKKRRWIGRGA